MFRLISLTAFGVGLVLLCSCTDSFSADSSSDNDARISVDDIKDSAIGEATTLESSVDVGTQDGPTISDAGRADSPFVAIDTGTPSLLDAEIHTQSIPDPEPLSTDDERMQALIGNWYIGPFYGRCKSESWRVYHPSFNFIYYLSQPMDCHIETVEGTYVLSDGNLLETTRFYQNSGNQSLPMALDSKTTREYIYIQDNDQSTLLYLDVFLPDDRTTWRRIHYERDKINSGIITSEEHVRTTLRFNAPLPLSNEDECEIEGSIWAYRYDDEAKSESFFSGPVFQDACEVSTNNGLQKISASTAIDSTTVFYDYPEWLEEYVEESVLGLSIQEDDPNAPFARMQTIHVWTKVEEVPF